MSYSITQDEADAYWSQRDVKKWVVTVSGGGSGKRVEWTRTVYVSARTKVNALLCAYRNATLPGKPRFSSIRLASHLDLGCIPT